MSLAILHQNVSINVAQLIVCFRICVFDIPWPVLMKLSTLHAYFFASTSYVQKSGPIEKLTS